MGNERVTRINVGRIARNFEMSLGEMHTPHKRWADSRGKGAYSSVVRVVLGRNDYVLFIAILVFTDDSGTIQPGSMKRNDRKRANMKAMVYSRPGGPEVLEIAELPDPVPGKGQIRIRVRAAALGLIDQQWFPKRGQRAPGILGTLMSRAAGAVGSPLSTEVSGVVDKVGPDVVKFKVGDPVFGPTIGMKGAGTAEFAILNSERAALIPVGTSFEDAAAMAGSFETAWGAVRTADIKPGMNVLVYGSSGGVGLYVAEIAKALGATVTGVCSSRNQAVARAAGLDHVVNYQTENVKSLATYQGKRFDRIILVNGNNPIDVYRGLLAPGGIIVGIGAAKQAMAVMLRSPFSRSFRAYSSVMTPERGYLDRAAELAAEGKIRPHVDAVYPIAQTADAVKYLLAQHAQGKVVVSVEF